MKLRKCLSCVVMVTLVLVVFISVLHVALAGEYSPVQYSWNGQYDGNPPSPFQTGSAGGYPADNGPFSDYIWESGWSGENASGGCNAQAEAFNPCFFDGDPPGAVYAATPSSAATASAEVNGEARRQWQPDQGADNDPPQPKSASASGSATCTFNASCEQQVGSSAKAKSWAIANTSLSAQGQKNSIRVPADDDLQTAEVPTSDNPPLYTQVGGDADTFSVSTTLQGAASLSVQVHGKVYAHGERTSNLQHRTADDGLGSATVSVSMSL